MSKFNRRHGRTDKNETAIATALRAAGITVHRVGQPLDLLVGHSSMGVRRTALIEVKLPDGVLGGKKDRGLKPAQEKFFATWTGGPAFVARDPGEALAPFGLGAVLVVCGSGDARWGAGGCRLGKAHLGPCIGFIG